MAYILVKDEPYYTNGSKVFACSLSADKVTVDFNNPVSFKEEIEFNCIYTEDEIKRRLGIFLIDTWDGKNQKVVKKTNKPISTIPKRDKE